MSIPLQIGFFKRGYHPCNIGRALLYISYVRGKGEKKGKKHPFKIPAKVFDNNGTCFSFENKNKNHQEPRRRDIFSKKDI